MSGREEFKKGFVLYNQTKYNESLIHFEKSANLGYSPSFVKLIQLYHFGRVGPKKKKLKEISWFTNLDVPSIKKLALSDDDDAQNILGYVFEKGYKIVKDEKEAFYWYQTSANNGNIDAQTNVGGCYNAGIGIKQDKEKAIYWYQIAAEQGHPRAQYNLGCYYEEGIKEDSRQREVAQKQSAYWLQKAANQGFINALNNLGHYYCSGYAFEQDYSQAFYLFQKAAIHGIPISQYNVGICYKNGFGVKKDNAKAFYWFQKAAKKQNDCDIQYCIGVCYKLGEGVFKNDDQAIYWFEKASLQGSTKAKSDLEQYSQTIFER